MKRQSCAVYGCFNTKTQNPDLTFYRLPPEKERRDVWLAKINREDLCDKNPKAHYVCGIHFQQSDVLPNNKRNLIKCTAIPSVKLPELVRMLVKKTRNGKPKEVCQFEVRPSPREDETTEKPVFDEVQKRAYELFMRYLKIKPPEESKLIEVPDSDNDEPAPKKRKKNINQMTRSAVVTVNLPNISMDEPGPSTSSAPDKPEVIVNSAEPLIEADIKTEPMDLGDMNPETYRNPLTGDIDIEFDSDDGVRESQIEIVKKEEVEKLRVISVDDVLKVLVKKRYISNDERLILNGICLNASALVTEIEIVKVYTENLKTFALTLYYYSPNGYHFLKDKYDTRLPEVKELRQWWKKPGGYPGFSEECLHAITEKVKQSNKKIYCGLILNEMAIRETVEFFGRYYGFFDVGTGLESDCLDAANEALVISVVALNADWKIPIGYFLTKNGVNGKQKAHLVQTAIYFLECCDVNVVALCFDGQISNIAMAKTLGCTLDSENLQPVFKTESGKSVCIYLDPCDMVMRICMALDIYKDLMDANRKLISMDHVTMLSQVLCKNNVQNVSMANQIFSRSIASTLANYKTDLKHLFSVDVDGTVQFVTKINDVIDILSSRDKAVGLKNSVNEYVKTEVIDILTWAANYFSKISSVHDTLFIKIADSQRNFGFIGLCATAKSAKILIETYLHELGKIQFHKLTLMSSNYLFCNLRPYKQFWEDPTARMFTIAYKIMCRDTAILKRNGGNCIPIENMSLLKVGSAVDKINLTTPMPNSNGEQAIPDDLENILNFKSNEFSDKVLDYIASYVVTHITNNLKCDICLGALLRGSKVGKKSATSQYVSDIVLKTTVIMKSNNFDQKLLFNIADDVMVVCKVAEQIMKRAIAESGGKIIHPKFTPSYLVRQAMENFIGVPLFDNIAFHQYDTDPMVNHIVCLCRALCEIYIETRLKHWEKKFCVPKMWLLSYFK